MFIMFLSPPARHRYINICTLVICLLFLTLGGCTRNYDGGINIPFVYKIDIQQGNVVDQNMIDRLQKGMDKTRVRFIMGTPVLADPFHSNRWEYIFSYQEGGKEREQRHISLHFEDEKLAYIEGDVETTRLQRPREVLKEGKSVVVPLSYGKKKGFFGRMTDKVTPWSDETPQDTESESVNTEPQIVDEADNPIEQLEEPPPKPEDESVHVESQIVDEADNSVENEAKKKGFFSRQFDKMTPASEEAPHDVETESVNLEQIEDETDSQIEQEDKDKKKGFFSRLFGKKTPGSEEAPQDTEPASVNE
jgi:outer membrane protein assembly factor BamE